LLAFSSDSPGERAPYALGHQCMFGLKAQTTLSA
jgi:hypothetical protein